MPLRVLFLCGDNTCRSQMAEGWLRTLGGTDIVARSAGLEPRHLHPLATRVMQEVGIDIARQRGKGLDAVKLERFDVVVTLSDLTTNLPTFRGAPRIRHVPISDPTWLESADGHDLEEFRRTRDELRELAQRLIDESA